MINPVTVDPGFFYVLPASLCYAVAGWVVFGDALYNSRCDISIPAGKLIGDQDIEFFSHNRLLGIDWDINQIFIVDKYR
jgi:hypothetical protein